MELVIYPDFWKFSFEVTFSNTATDLLAMEFDDKKFSRTEYYSNSIVQSRFKSEILVLSVIEKYLLNQYF